MRSGVSSSCLPYLFIKVRFKPAHLLHHLSVTMETVGNCGVVLWTESSFLGVFIHKIFFSWELQWYLNIIIIMIILLQERSGSIPPLNQSVMSRTRMRPGTIYISILILMETQKAETTTKKCLIRPSAVSVYSNFIVFKTSRTLSQTFILSLNLNWIKWFKLQSLVSTLQLTENCRKQICRPGKCFVLLNACKY